MSTRKITLVLGIVMVFVMLVAVIPVWAGDPMPTDRYDLLPRTLEAPSALPVTGKDPMPTDRYDLLPRTLEAPSSLPVTGLGRGQQADAARWNGLADRYLGSGPSSLPVTGLGRGQLADAARWRASGGIVRQRPLSAQSRHGETYRMVHSCRREPWRPQKAAGGRGD